MGEFWGSLVCIFCCFLSGWPFCALLLFPSYRLSLYCLSTGQTCGDPRLRCLLSCPVRTRCRLHVHSPHRHPCHPSAGPPRCNWEEVPLDQVTLSPATASLDSTGGRAVFIYEVALFHNVKDQMKNNILTVASMVTSHLYNNFSEYLLHKTAKSMWSPNSVRTVPELNKVLLIRHTFFFRLMRHMWRLENPDQSMDVDGELI